MPPFLPVPPVPPMPLPPLLSLMPISHHHVKNSTPSHFLHWTKKMAKKGKIDTTPAPNTPNVDTVDASARSPGLITSKSPYLLINGYFLTSSTSTKKISNKTKNKMTIKLLSNIPLQFMLFPLSSQRISPDPLAQQSQTPHIQWEITFFIPRLPLPKPPKNDKNYNQWWSYFPLPPCPIIFLHFFPKGSRLIPRLYSIQPPIFID